jgi:putative transposase
MLGSRPDRFRKPVRSARRDDQVYPMVIMTKPIPLQHGRFYHIYNRGINRENIFLEQRNYLHFLKLYMKHIVPIAYTYAYCLLRNHFHFLLQIKTPEQIVGGGENLTGFENLSGLVDKPPSKIFSNFFNAYAKAINIGYGRTGSLFQRPFGRIEVDSEPYFIRLVTYIHHNPVRHGFVDDFRDWPYSSYNPLISTKPTQVERATVLDWFGGREAFIETHKQPVSESQIGWLIGDDE